MSRAAPERQSLLVRSGLSDSMRPVPPAELLRPGRLDSLALLTLWLIRQSSNLVLVLGLIPPIVAGQFTAAIASRLDTPRELLDALLTPLVFLAFALLTRILVTLAALVLSYPRSEAEGFDPAVTPRRGWYMRRYDAFTLARGRRQLRWSWAVRRTAAGRLGWVGGTLEGLGRVATYALVPAFGLVVLAIALFD